MIRQTSEIMNGDFEDDVSENVLGHEGNSV